MASKDSGGGQQRVTRREDETPEAQEAPAATEGKEKLDEDVDALLEDIDNVLEENAEEFVKQFVQKGGE
jgi:ubiquitin-like protein Pup